MKFRRKYTITSIIIFVLLFLSANVYFVQILFEDKQVYTAENVISKVKYTEKEDTLKTPKPPIKLGTIIALEKIKQKLNQLPSRYYKRKTDANHISKQLLDDLNETVPLSSDLFLIADQWANPTELVPSPAPVLGSVLRTLCTSQIRKAENSAKGTQLKLLLTFDGGWQGLFKPQWYERGEVLWGPSYGGKDRHNGEVASFHLSLLLGLPRVPLTVGRRLHLPLEVIPVADHSLRNTFSINGSATCFYGVCMYCTPKEPVCGKTIDGIGGGPYLEGALSLWLPQKLLPLKRHRSPWQRTYKPGKPARWELNKDYCQHLLDGNIGSSGKSFKSDKIPTRSRLLDLIDAAIFDFLIGNGDRHHHETFLRFPNSTILLIDNGKSFGNPYDDHLDILAPLYQCCILWTFHPWNVSPMIQFTQRQFILGIFTQTLNTRLHPKDNSTKSQFTKCMRQKTWERLILLSGGVLGEALESLLRPSHLTPILSATHYVALNRRLLYVYATVENCLDVCDGSGMHKLKILNLENIFNSLTTGSLKNTFRINCYKSLECLLVLLDFSGTQLRALSEVKGVIS